jgi:hypothetical protein
MAWNEFDTPAHLSAEFLLQPLKNLIRRPYAVHDTDLTVDWIEHLLAARNVNREKGRRECLSGRY